MPDLHFVAKAWMTALCVIIALLVTIGFSGVAAAAATEQALYDFCSENNCADGAFPDATLIMDQAGNLYGTTPNGGSGSHCPNSQFTGNGCGVVFELTPNPGGGWTETVLYAFCSKRDCTDGSDPFASKLIMDGAGNLYGTTEFGGANNPGDRCLGLGCGVVFELTPKQSGGWTYSVIYDFCSQPNCADGAEAGGGLIMDKAGNLYGTAGGGSGQGDGGVVFELTPKQSGGWTETVLYNFCSQANCTDGENPFPDDGLIMDASGNLFGTASGGGSNGFGGVVFQLTPNQSGDWTETVLYAFCSESNCSDGETPQASLIMDANGNLYSTTTGGGAHSDPNCSNDSGPCGGVVFELSPKVDGDWTETVLYNFCSQGGNGCTDGEDPDSGLLMDAAGNLYGTTPGGGNPNVCTQFTPSGCASFLS